MKAAKNTIKVASLCLPSLKVWVGENANDFAPLLKLTEDNAETTALLYPSHNAVAIEEQGKHQHIRQLLLIDGTWKKAFKIYQLNPWLHSLGHLAITATCNSYNIRKSPSEKNLSSLEAIAVSLQHLEGTDTTPLMNIFSLFQQKFYQYKKREI